MDWTQIGAAAVGAFIIWMMYRQRGSIKKLMEESKAAPQHWGIYIALMLAVIALIYLLIKL